MSQTISAQIAIIGGGIAGLWLLNRLSKDGYDAVLLEKNALGGGQTLASQGIIHGGLKYALNGALSPASSAIADMPERWRRCLTGDGELDLSACRVLSPHYFMWSNSGYRSRLKTFLGSKALHGRIDALQRSQYPDFFQHPGVKGTLYQLTDFVLDTPSLLKTLAEPSQDRIFHCPRLELQSGTNGDIDCILAQGKAGNVSIKAQRYILCAGEGNEALLAQVGVGQMPMQRRPLHMVYVHMNHPAPVYVHCIGDNFGMTPLLTLTSHPYHGSESEPGTDFEAVTKNPDQWIWYIGGEIAERGVAVDSEQQQALAKQQLSKTFSWVDFSQAHWGSFLINRAEPRVSNLQRPDNAWVEARQNFLVTWPTKLTLSPNLGDAVSKMLREQKILPEPESSAGNNEARNGLFDFPGIARPRWHEIH